MLTFAFLFSTLLAQTPEPAAATYAKLCAGCHGDDAQGSQQGPGLAGNASLKRKSAAAVRTIIRKGVPAAGMPGFNLPDATLDALVAMVSSLNAVAADVIVAGDPAAGESHFFGAGQCATCHMVFGRGTASAPDLSNVARELTLDQLKQALLNPSARLAPGYAVTAAALKDGRTVRGYTRGRTRFHVAIQEPNGAFHPLSLDQVAKLTEEKASLMPAVAGAPETVQNLLAYLSRLKGLTPGLTVAPSASKNGITWADIQNPKPGDWLTYNGNLNGNRYSPLKQINKTNAAKLTLKWTYSVPLWTQFLPDTPYFRENMRYFGLETVPLVTGGVMYATGPNQVFALDARTGEPIWNYSRPRTPGLVSDPSLGTNRGVALLGDLVFFVTDNAHLLALHRVTGRLVWEQILWDEPQKYGGTIAPLIVKDMVVAGVAGGDWGIRGFVSAYKAATGERVWRHWTVPTDGEPGRETWKGSSYKLGGGSTWLTGSYDASTDTLYWATGNPWPNSDDRERGGDNLYTDCVLALDANTGKLKWHYQFTPHDTHDWDATEPNVLVDALFQGRQRKLLLHADRNGFFYVFDRLDGKLLVAKSFMHRITWASGIGADGRPVMLPPSPLNCPDHATNWNGTAFSPVTKLYYVMATEKCTVRMTSGAWKNPPPPEGPGAKYLRALNIETGKIEWEVQQVGPVDGKRVAGVLGTAGGLLFYGDPSGYFVAADEKDGKTLWRIPLNATIKTSAMTYAVDGQQYVTLAVGANLMTFGLSQ